MALGLETMVGGSGTFQILILAAEPAQAERVLRTLRASGLPVSGIVSHDPSELQSLQGTSACDLILARIGGSVRADAVGQAYVSAQTQPPLMILASDRSDANGLLDLMQLGAVGLIAEDDKAALTATVSRHWKQAELQAEMATELHALRQRVAHLELSPDTLGAGGAGGDSLSRRPGELLQGPEAPQAIGLDESSFRPELLSASFDSDPLPDPLAPSSVSSERLSQSISASSEPQRVPNGDTHADAIRDSLIVDIERALDEHDFRLMYQPIVSLKGDSREHYSVLVRLADPVLSSFPAGTLLLPAARGGRLPDLDRWVIQRGLKELGHRRDAGAKFGFFLSLSAEIVQDDRLLIWICDALKASGVRGSQVTFQFQEDDTLFQLPRWESLVAGLRKVKCRICINQFGRGEQREPAFSPRSSMVAPDFIKLAPELAQGLAQDPAKQRRLLELVRLCGRHGVKTIVTGVDDARSLALMWSFGIDYVQSHFLQAPASTFDPRP